MCLVAEWEVQHEALSREQRNLSIADTIYLEFEQLHVQGGHVLVLSNKISMHVRMLYRGAKE